MANFIHIVATMQYPCPKCKQPSGKDCITPKRKKRNAPHMERMMKLNRNDMNECKLLTATFEGISHD